MRCIFMILFLTLLSCQTEKNTKETEKISGEKIETPDDFLDLRIHFVRDSLLFLHKNSGNSLVDVYRLLGHKLQKEKTLIGRGSGPDDLQASSFSSYGNEAYFCSFYEGKGFRVSLETISDSAVLHKIVFPFKNTTMIAATFSDAYLFTEPGVMLLMGGDIGEENILSTYDLESGTLLPAGFWITDDIKAETITKQLVYTSNSTLYRHPEKQKFIYACGSGEYVEMFSMEGDKVSDRKSILKRKPLYYSVGIDFKIERSEVDKPHGIKKIIPTEKYIYIMPNSIRFDKDWKEITYKGYSYRHNDIFQVFDWEGNHIKNIELELPCWDLAWDAANNLLYTITEAGDSNIVMRYQLE